MNQLMGQTRRIPDHILALYYERSEGLVLGINALFGRAGHGINVKVARDGLSEIEHHLLASKDEITNRYFKGTFARFPPLRRAARKSLDIQAAVLLALIAFNTEPRKNGKELKSWHSLEVGSDVAKLVASAPLTLEQKQKSIIVAVTHDLDEDTYIKEASIRLAFTRYNIADSVKRLSVYVQKTGKWRRDVELKRLAKIAQAATLQLHELLVKAVDNIVNMNKDLNDFRKGLIVIAGNKVIFTNSGKMVDLEEFRTKIAHRAAHHQDYMARLKLDPQGFGTLTDALDKRFRLVAEGLKEFLEAPAALAAPEERWARHTSTRRALPATLAGMIAEHWAPKGSQHPHP